MLSKKLTTVTLMLTATIICLSGCSTPDKVSANIPTTGPAISSPATPTSEATQNTSDSEVIATLTPTATPTPSWLP